MKRITNIIVLMLILSAFTSAFAADTKVNGRLYANWNMDMTDGADNANSFGIDRAYVTVKSKLSDYTSVRMTSDISSTNGYDGYSIILKYGYIDWKPQFGNGTLNIRFGLQPTLYIDDMNGLWGRRYLEKTIGDKNKFLTSSDLGASAFVNLGKDGKSGYLALQLLNGTSYSKVEEMNSNKDIGVFAHLMPFASNEDFKGSHLLAQFYAGTQNVSLETEIDSSVNPIVVIANDASQFKNQIASVGGLLAYKNSFDFGFDANFQTKGQGYNSSNGAALDDRKSSGLSFFGTLCFDGLSSNEKSFGRTLNLFGRYDILDPNTDVDNDGKSLMIVGVECAPTKGFKASVNFRNTSYEQDGIDSESHIFLNTLFKF